MFSSVENPVSDGGHDLDDYDKDEIERIRNVSRLSSKLRRRLPHVNQPPTKLNEYQKSRQYQRRLYAKYGAASGVDPRIMWPTKPELQEMITYAKEWEPSVKQTLKKLKSRTIEEEEKNRNRQAKIEKNMAKMPEWIENYHEKVRMQEAKQQKIELKNQEMLEEAREQLGYKPTIRDPVFRAMLKGRDEARKKDQQKEKKLAREQKGISRLKKMAEVIAAD